MQNKRGIRIYLAYMAAIVMIIGVNLPLYVQLSNKGEAELVTRIDNEGIILFMTAIASMVFRYLRKNKYLLIPIIYQFGTLAYYVIIFTQNSRFKSIHIGFVCEIISLLLLVISLFIDINVGNNYTHDMSTIRVIETEEYVYNNKIILKDWIWIIIVFLVTVSIVGLKLYVKNDKSSAANKISEAKSSNEDLHSNGCDYECEEYALSIDDAYITNDNEKEIVFVSIKIKNKMKKAISFSEVFTMGVKQGNSVLEKCGEIKSTTFDVNSQNALISYCETSNIYIPYILNSSEQDVSIGISAIINKQEMLLTNKVLHLNDLYYVDEIAEIIEHDRQTNIETTKREQNNMKKENDDIDNSGDSSKNESVEEGNNKEIKEDTQSSNGNTDKKTTETKKSVSPEDNTKTEEPSKTEEPVQSKEPSESKQPVQNSTEPVKDKISGNIKFQKPSAWDDKDKVYLCLYNNEDDTEEYAKIYMKDYENGVYTFFVSNVTKGKTVYIAFTNGKEIYPSENKFILFLGQKYKSN